MKKKVYKILEKSVDGDFWSYFVDVFLIILILINVAAVVLETVEDYYLDYKPIFQLVEYFSIVVFSAEYLLRLWCITVDPKYSHPVKGRIKYMISASAIIDMLAILPFYLPAFIAVDGRVLRLLRIFRIFRLLKFKRYSKSVELIGKVVKDKREELIVSLIMTMTLLLLCSCFMYYIEFEAQPDKFSSIPATMWWGVATLTTVGYGDIYPITGLGRFLGSIMAILGVGVFALPAGILANGFGDAFSKRADEKKDK